MTERWEKNSRSSSLLFPSAAFSPTLSPTFPYLLALIFWQVATERLCDEHKWARWFPGHAIWHVSVAYGASAGDLTPAIALGAFAYLPRSLTTQLLASARRRLPLWA